MSGNNKLGSIKLDVTGDNYVKLTYVLDHGHGSSMTYIEEAPLPEPPFITSRSVLEAVVNCFDSLRWELGS